MKKIICKSCGEISHYIIIEKVRHALMFDSNDNPCGASDNYGIYFGSVKRCPYCNRKITIIELED